MIKRTLIILFSITLSSITFASNCNISLPKYLLIIDTNSSNAHNLKSNCPKVLTDKFLSLVSGFDGKVKTSYLLKIFNEHFKAVKPSFSRNEFKIIKVENHIKEYLNLEPALYIQEVESIDNSGFVFTDDINNIHVKKISNKLGEKSFKLDLGRTGKTLWLKGSLVREVEVLKAKRDVVFGEKNLSKNLFITSKLLTTTPDDFLITAAKIPYFKTVRAINKNSILKNSDLTPILLVRAFRKVNVSVKRGALHLSYKLMALSNGHIGDKIKLKNEKSKRIIFGKVTGFDEATLSL